MDRSNRSTRTADCCRGSLIVDAAVCLPVFLIAMSLLLLLIMQAGTEDTCVRAAVCAGDACVKTAAAGGVADTDAWDSALQTASFTAALHAELSEEWEDGPTVHVAGFFTQQNAQIGGGISIDHLNVATVSCRRMALFSLPGTDGISSVRTFVFRPWEGESKQQFDADGERVYVFPKYGERYHSYGCRVMQEGSVEAILTEQFKRRYAACKTCRPSTLSYGSLVFLFSDGSRVYHRKECACITKYYVSMPLSEAEAEGYTPCLFCRGGS